MAARLRPDPLGELKRSPRLPSRNKGGLLLRGGEEKGGEGRGGRRGRGGGTCSKVLGGIDAPGNRKRNLGDGPQSYLTQHCQSALLPGVLFAP